MTDEPIDPTQNVTFNLNRVKEAEIISMDHYVSNQYEQLRKVLINGRYINPPHREKLINRMKQCMRIKRNIARSDTSVYTFTMESPPEFGNPLRDALVSWPGAYGTMMEPVEFTEYKLKQIQFPNDLSIDIVVDHT